MVLTSVDTLRDICKAVPIPVNAIGGLNKNNIDVLSGVPEHLRKRTAQFHFYVEMR